MRDRVTHERRLADVGDPLRTFLAAIEPLGRRTHALWIQLPPSFSPADLGALTGFLRCLPGGYRYSVEVRHRAFFEDPRSEQQLERALGDVGAEWVTFDTTVLFEGPPTSDAEREAWRKKPRLPRRSRARTGHHLSLWSCGLQAMDHGRAACGKPPKAAGRLPRGASYLVVSASSGWAMTLRAPTSPASAKRQFSANE